jgi:prepilin-type N-terminal cleavage/methylation domain-containing protein
MKRKISSGFTLVELLVVIAIIGILVSLLLPAVQSAREAARSLQCKNNLKQLALATRSHLANKGHFPANGWNYRYAGDPDKGFGREQPGGWHYNILPFIEQSNLRELGQGLSDAERRETGKQVCGTIVNAFICPTRGNATPSPFEVPSGYQFSNINRPEVFARSDYAANAGSRESGWCNYNTINQTGVIYSRDGLPSAQIRDGATNTYLIGERYIDPDHYTNGSSPGNDQGWVVGHDFDAFRCTDFNAADPANSAKYKPRRDTPGLNVREMFGSAHSNFHMSMCDGSVHSIAYSIDQEIHFRLGNRDDGQAIPESAF